MTCPPVHLRPSLLAAVQWFAFASAGILGALVAVPRWLRTSGPPPSFVLAIALAYGLALLLCGVQFRLRLARRITLDDDGLEVEGRAGTRALRWDAVARVEETAVLFQGHDWTFFLREGPKLTVSLLGLSAADQRLFQERVRSRAAGRVHEVEPRRETPGHGSTLLAQFRTGAKRRATPTGFAVCGALTIGASVAGRSLGGGPGLLIGLVVALFLDLLTWISWARSGLGRVRVMTAGVIVEPTWSRRSFGWVEVEEAVEADFPKGGGWMFTLSAEKSFLVSTEGLSAEERATLRGLLREHLGDRVSRHRGSASGEGGR